MYFLASNAVAPQLSRNRHAQRVGATPGAGRFVARDAVAGAHRACIKFTAVAVVVAHFDRLAETLRSVATSARRADRFGQRIILHVPCAPVECGFDRDSFVAVGFRLEAEEGRVIHLWRINHLAGIEQIVRVKRLFNLAKSACDCGPKLPLNPFTATQAVAVLAAVCALEFTN